MSVSVMRLRDRLIFDHSTAQERYCIEVLRQCAIGAGPRMSCAAHAFMCPVAMVALGFACGCAAPGSAGRALRASPTVAVPDTGGDAIPKATCRPPPPRQPVQILEVIAFDSGRSILRDDAIAILDEIAAVLIQSPEDFPHISIEGHAGDGEPYPISLSLHRAEVVRAMLVGRGVDAARLTVHAHGLDSPPCTNPTSACPGPRPSVDFVTIPICDHSSASGKSR